MATIAERIKLLDEMHAREREIMIAKSHDYSGKEDCNKNIRASEAIGVCDAKRALLVRILDKMSRMANLLDKESEAKVNESIDDTIGDARNYLAILQHLIAEDRNAA